MKNSFVLFTFLIPILAFSQFNSGSRTNNDEAAIRKVLDEQTRSWNRGDIEAFMQGYWKNDSLMFIGKSGINWGWKKTLDNYRRAYPDTTAMGKLSYEVIVVKKLSAEYFYVVGNWTLSRRIGDLSGYYNLLFKKISGQWLIIADHSS